MGSGLEIEVSNSESASITAYSKIIMEVS